MITSPPSSASWIAPAARSLVVEDGEYGGGLAAQLCAAGRIGEYEVHRFVRFVDVTPLAAPPVRSTLMVALPPLSLRS